MRIILLNVYIISNNKYIIDGRAVEIEIERCCNKKKSNSLETLSYYSKNIGHLVGCINNSESTDTTEDNQIVLSPVSVKDTYEKKISYNRYKQIVYVIKNRGCT